MKIRFEYTIVGLFFAVVLCFYNAVTHGKPLNKSTIQKFDSTYVVECTFRKEVIGYASTFLGTPYKYAGQNPKGFDCSGYVSYVFKKYNIDLYTSALYMAKQGKKISLNEAKEGDVIFFTGTNSKVRQVGHVGIVTSKAGDPISFIHCSSGKAYCVKYDSLNSPYYINRFMFVSRVIANE